MSLNPKSIIIISNTSIGNNIAMFIIYVYSYSNIVKKILHYAINVTLTEAEIFSIRGRINQAIQVLDVFHIIIITDTIHIV